MDEATRDFFRRQFQEPENKACVDLGTANPQWASISHGCYISLESSGVHRSLGVHISFVRSTTMDSWKPIQLKFMELGGNQKLKAFFKQHNIPDDMPIPQKYSTRAAEWYRRNLRALAEGGEPPPPLAEGTGHLPVDGAPSATPVSFARPSSMGMMSAGGAFASDARHYGGGYHDAGSAEHSDASPAPRKPMEGFGSGGLASSRRPMDGFGSDGTASSSSGAAGEDDFLSGILGRDVGAKVSTGVWSAVGLVGSFASQAKSMAESKVQQAQQERWFDSALDVAKQGMGAAVEAGRATYSYVNETGGQAVLGRTAEVIGSTAKRSMSMVGSGADWVSEQLGSLGQDSTATGLQALSSGRMQGFGSDGPLPTQASAQTEGRCASEAASGSLPSRLSYHLAPGPELRPRKPSMHAGTDDIAPPPPRELRPAASAPTAAGAALPAPSRKADVWNDEDW